jgi:hypothetical protein
MPIDMGIGALGFNNLIFKRKFRWTLRIFDICGGQEIPKDYVKLAARPNITIEETEINHLNAKTWIPGKGTWETITVTYYDVATIDIKPLYDWLATVYDFVDPVALKQGSIRADYAGKAELVLYDGCGQELEIWTLGDVWPQAINFGELDYSNSEEVTIELTLRYSDVAYEPICPSFNIESCCTPCGGDSNRSTAGTGVFPNTGSNLTG